MDLKHLLIILAMTFSYTAFAQQREHTVERGETLASIAKKYYLTEEQLKAANPNLTTCFAGVRLVIPDPNAPALTKEKAKDSSDDKKKDKSAEKEAADSTKTKKNGQNGVFGAIGKVAKATGNAAAAIAISKLKGESWYDAISKGYESADSTIKVGKNVADKKATNNVKESSTAPKQEEPDPKLMALYNEYKTKYDDYIGQLEKIKGVYSKANDVAKRRTWKNVSETVKDYKTQLEKIRTECEMYTGKEIVASDLESWVPVAPSLNSK